MTDENAAPDPRAIGAHDCPRCGEPYSLDGCGCIVTSAATPGANRQIGDGQQSDRQTRDWMAVSDRLRRAAALMRDRAESADSAMPGPWYTSDDVLWQLLYSDGDDRLTVFDCLSCGYAAEDPPRFRGGHGVAGTCEEVVIYLASWPPSMAVAVAALLDDTAGHVEYTKTATGDDVEHALAVAKAYLEPSTSPALASSSSGGSDA